jgi:anti-sigma factor RsiW
MNHLSQEDIVAAYYGEPGSEEHLAACAECRAELARLATVLDRVTAPEVPEPADDYEDRVWQRLRWRMRSEATKSRLTGLMKWTAVAAVTFMAFCTGLLWRKQAAPIPQEAAVRQTQTAQPVSNTPNTQAQRDRILLVVVNDHFDRSERVLVELTNLTPNESPIDIDAERAVAEELLTSNRLYRRTALDRGEESVATLLDELEPVLMQIAHAPNDMTADELRRIQKRVEAKGLVFKLRVVRNDTRTGEQANNVNQPNV